MKLLLPSVCVSLYELMFFSASGDSASGWLAWRTRLCAQTW